MTNHIQYKKSINQEVNQVKKNIALSLIMVCVLLALSLAGCAQPEPATPQSPQTPQTLAVSEPLNWRFTINDPASSVTAAIQEEMVDRIAERSGGQLNITIHYVGELGYGAYEMHRVVSEGLAEMGQTVSSAFNEQNVFLILDQFIYDTQAERINVYKSIRPDMDKTAASMNMKLLGAWAWPMCSWFSTVKLGTADDFRGAKLRTWNQMVTTYLERMGAAAITCDYSEMYTAMSTGVIQGTLNQAISMYDMKFYEICPFQNFWPMPSAYYINFVNTEAFAGLPSDLQEILVEESAATAEECQQLLLAPDGDLFQERLQFFIDYGQEQVYPSEADLEKSREVCKTVWSEWQAGLSPEEAQIMDKVLDILGRK